MSGVNCRGLEGALIELARRGPLSADERAAITTHLQTCAGCRAAFDAQVRLCAAAKALGEEVRHLSPPLSVDTALFAELNSTRRFQRRRFIYGAAGGAIAASLAIVWWFAYRPEPRLIAANHVAAAAIAPAVSWPEQPTAAVAMPRSDGRHRRGTAKPVAEPEQPFIAIPYTLPLEPYERADVMRMDLPVAALIAAGLPMSMVDPGANARADVLVGQDGRARAIRLISISDSN